MVKTGGKMVFARKKMAKTAIKKWLPASCVPVPAPSGDFQFVKESEHFTPKQPQNVQKQNISLKTLGNTPFYR